ncbi:MAG: response regulator transcription factor [Chloroherpetonaceae bacterium]
MKKILIVEDDRDIASLIAINLGDMDCQTDIVHNGEDGVLYATQNNYDAIILDVMLPKLNGIEACKRIRQNRIETPILMLTSLAEEADKITGIDVGADDYITKPFSVRELMARVKARIRRYHPDKEPGFISTPSRFHAGGLMIDAETHKTTLNGKSIDLTVKEFELLSVFMRHPGRAFSRAELLDLVWGHNFNGFEHTVNSHINRLRMKIEKDAANPKYILTVWGIGYKFNDEL